MRQRFFRWYDVGAAIFCPRHPHQQLPVKGNETQTELLVRQSLGSGEFRIENVMCFTGVCQFGCPVRYACRNIDTDDGPLVGYSFQCVRCDSFTQETDHGGWCIICRLKPAFPNLTWLLTGLAEADIVQTPSRRDFVESLLHGLLTGQPGLTCEDPI